MILPDANAQGAEGAKMEPDGRATPYRMKDCRFYDRRDGHGWAWPAEKYEEFVRNEERPIAWGTVDGEKVPIHGYIARCKLCGTEYPVIVG